MFAVALLALCAAGSLASGPVHDLTEAVGWFLTR
jgi:hypothetical protein